jgi:hypothetical protein
MKRLTLITSGTVIAAMMFGTTTFAANNGNGVKDMIDAISKQVVQIESDLGLVKQQAADANTAAQNAQSTAQTAQTAVQNAATQAQNANTAATNANTTAQQAQQQVATLQQEVDTLKATVDAQKAEIDSLQSQVQSTMNKYVLQFVDSYNKGVSGVPITINGLGTFTTDNNGNIVIYLPVISANYSLTVGNNYKTVAYAYYLTGIAYNNDVLNNRTSFQTSGNLSQGQFTYNIQITK